MFNCISTPLTQAEIITVLGSAPYAIFRTCKHPYSIPITFDYTWDNNQLCFELFTGALHRGICPGQKVCLEFQTTAPGGIVQIVTVEGRIVKDCNGNPTILSGSGCGCYCGC